MNMIELEPLKIPDEYYEINLPSINPYKEDTDEYHCFVDVAVVNCMKGWPGVVSTAMMMHEFSMTYNYYKKHLPQLIADGYIRRVYILSDYIGE